MQSVWRCHRMRIPMLLQSSSSVPCTKVDRVSDEPVSLTSTCLPPQLVLTYGLLLMADSVYAWDPTCANLYWTLLCCAMIKPLYCLINLKMTCVLS
eukprot:6372883-Ditylum_brightwellii.AAC.1